MPLKKDVSEKRLESKSGKVLDLTKLGEQAEKLRETLRSRIVGQDHAMR